MRVGSPGKVTGAGAISTIRRVVLLLTTNQRDFPCHENGQNLVPDENFASLVKLMDDMGILLFVDDLVYRAFST
jgi:hypothetical protein